MNVITQEFKKAVRSVKAAGRGGQHDEQRVIVRAANGKLTLTGIGTEEKPGTKASCRLKYHGKPVSIITSLVGLRWLAGAVSASDALDVEVCEKTGISIKIAWPCGESRATLAVRPPK